MKRVAYEVALKEQKHVAEDTIACVFEKPDGFRFEAGQHIRMTLLNPLETDREGNSRFFSLVNTPQEQDLVIAMRMRDTAFKRVLGQMQPGDKVRIEILLKSPHRAFTLHDEPARPAVFLIGGIGIVPAFSIIKDALERKLPHTMVLFYANRRPEDAPFLDELEDMAQHHPTFTLIATMTQPEKSAHAWQRETGYIDRAMLERYVDDLKSPIYYIAGLPEMVNAMKTMLKASGVHEQSIHTEEFSGFMLPRTKVGTKQAWKRKLLFGAIALMIGAAVLIHTTAVIVLYKAGLSTVSFFMAGIILVIVLLKVFAIVKLRSRHVSSLKHDKEQETVRM